MADIVAAGNTFNPSLLVLRDKGYRLWVEESGDRNLWCAARDNHDFMAYSPPELLGICCLFEAFGEDWNRQKPSVLREILGGSREDPEATP